MAFLAASLLLTLTLFACGDEQTVTRSGTETVSTETTVGEDGADTTPPPDPEITELIGPSVHQQKLEEEKKAIDIASGENEFAAKGAVERRDLS